MRCSSIATMLRKAVCVVMAASLLTGASPVASGATAPGNAYEEIQVLKGDIQSIPAKNVKRVSITDALIADVNDARANAVEVMGMAPGQTVLFIWDDSGKRTVVIRVVAEDPKFVRKRLQGLLESAGLTTLVLRENLNEGRVVITGELFEGQMAALDGILAPFRDSVINLVQQVKNNDMVQIDMQVTELSSTLDKQMGVKWGPTDSPLAYSETMPTTQIPKGNGSFGDLFKIGSFARTTELIAAINFLITKGKAKILSKPRLVVISGKSATFLVGGEVPIRTQTAGSTTGLITTTSSFKSYGVSMAITPTIENNKINTLLNVQISEIDTGVTTISGDPSFLTRTAQTQLVLDDHQTIVLAGMIKRRNTDNTTRIPILGAIPLLGSLFRSRGNGLSPDLETEVVISITATILRAQKAGADAVIVPEAVDSIEKKENPALKSAPLPVAASAAAPTAAPVVKSALPPASAPAADKPTAPAAGKVTAAKPEAATRPAAAPASSGPAGSEAYAAALQEKISSAIAYPYEAQEKGWQGTVKLGLVIQKDGMLKSVVVKESSGYPVFDQDAVNTAQILAPFSAFPAGIAGEEIALTVPIVYSLNMFLKNVSNPN